jgi:hypothetical protein
LNPLNILITSFIERAVPGIFSPCLACPYAASVEIFTVLRQTLSVWQAFLQQQKIDVMPDG